MNQLKKDNIVSYWKWKNCYLYYLRTDLLNCIKNYLEFNHLPHETSFFGVLALIFSITFISFLMENYCTTTEERLILKNKKTRIIISYHFRVNAKNLKTK